MTYEQLHEAAKEITKTPEGVHVYKHRTAQGWLDFAVRQSLTRNSDSQDSWQIAAMLFRADEVGQEEVLRLALERRL